MNRFVRRFITQCCELMPEGNVPIFEYEEDPDAISPIPGMEVMKETQIATGPQDYLTYTIDCYQLYLWYLGWKDRPLAGNMPFTEFVIEISKEPKIKIIKNWRYQAGNMYLPEEIKPLLGKMFIGVRHNTKTWESGNRYRY